MEDHRGWFRPKRLPHFDAVDTTQFLTIRLDDSLPKSVLEKLEEDLKDSKSNRSIERIERIEVLLDSGHGSCILRNEQCALLVQNALQFLSNKRFDLIAWVIMPNHAHFLARFNHAQSLPVALHSLKSFTSNEIKKIHPELGSVWQKEYFDRYIRNEDHYLKVLNYIHENPVKAGLCQIPEEFRWSSAFDERN